MQVIITVIDFVRKQIGSYIFLKKKNICGSNAEA